MAYTLEEFVKRDLTLEQNDTCENCHAPYLGKLKYIVEKKNYCEDCYYDELSKVIDETPIVTPGRYRF